MTAFQIVSEFQLIVQKLNLSKDNRWQKSERLILELINQKRARAIIDMWDKTHIIDPSWLQTNSYIQVTPLNSADTPEIPKTSVSLGKFSLPYSLDYKMNKGTALVSLFDMEGNNMGLTVATTSFQKEYNQITQDRFYKLHKVGGYKAKHNYFFEVGNDIYIANADCVLPNFISCRYILDDPTCSDVLITTYIKSGQLKLGDTYIVIEGQITHNGIPYYEGDLFVAVNYDFTDEGKVFNSVMKRKFDINFDQYPMSYSLMKQIFIEFFSNEYKIEGSAVEGAMQGTDKKIVNATN